MKLIQRNEEAKDEIHLLGSIYLKATQSRYAIIETINALSIVCLMKVVFHLFLSQKFFFMKYKVIFMYNNMSQVMS